RRVVVFEVDRAETLTALRVVRFYVLELCTWLFAFCSLVEGFTVDLESMAKPLVCYEQNTKIKALSSNPTANTHKKAGSIRSTRSG
ncbi:MAG TPA: hypothetical protein VIJ87_06035, partial [Pyrinomonadaceae bacterium]